VENLIKLILAPIIIIAAIIANPVFADDTLPQPYQQRSHSLETRKPWNRQDRDVRINTFKITPTHLLAGQQANLIWNVSGATRVFIDNHDDLNQAEVSPSGHLTIIPLKTTSYIISAFNERMVNASAVATIDVQGQPPAPIVSIDANPNNIPAGKKTILSWQTRFADTVSIDNGIGKVGSNGTIAVELSKTTTFNLVATGLGGSNTTNITIKVLPYQSAHIKITENGTVETGE
jgi:hypothetical protein